MWCGVASCGWVDTRGGRTRGKDKWGDTPLYDPFLFLLVNRSPYNFVTDPSRSRDPALSPERRGVSSQIIIFLRKDDGPSPGPGSGPGTRRALNKTVPLRIQNRPLFYPIAIGLKWLSFLFDSRLFMIFEWIIYYIIY